MEDNKGKKIKGVGNKNDGEQKFVNFYKSLLQKHFWQLKPITLKFVSVLIILIKGKGNKTRHRVLFQISHSTFCIPILCYFYKKDCVIKEWLRGMQGARQKGVEKEKIRVVEASSVRNTFKIVTKSFLFRWQIFST